MRHSVVHAVRINLFCNFKFALVLSPGIGYIATMKRGQITAVCLLGGLLFSTGVKAVVTDTKGDDYKVIVERNVFGLNPPKTNEVVVAPPPPAAEVKLAGITTIVSPPRAILNWKEPGLPAAPGRPATPPGKEESYIFREGEKQGIIKVVEINVKAGSVKIENGGVPTLLTFETHGVKLPNTPAPAVPGTLPTPPGGARPGVPNPTASLNPGTPGRGLPAAGNPNPATVGANPAGSGLASVPPRPLRGGGPGTPTAVAQNPPMTPEAQVILMEVERERTKPEVAAGVLPPIPPTVLTPVDTEEQP